MFQDRAVEQAREARQQRRALLIFSLAVVILLGFCGTAGFRMLTLPAKLYPVGQAADFADAAQRCKGQFIRPRHQDALAEAASPK